MTSEIFFASSGATNRTRLTNSGTEVYFQSELDKPFIFSQWFSSNYALNVDTGNRYVQTPHIKIDDKCVLPKITTTARDALSSTLESGFLIYNSTTNKMNFYNGSAWREINDSAV